MDDKTSEVYRPFGDQFSATANDFKASESYRWVRLGVLILIFGYTILFPILTAWLFYFSRQEDAPFEILVSFGIGVLISVFLLAVGFVLLRCAPKANERAAANKFLMAYGVVIACFVLDYAFDVNQLHLIRRIASAYGSYFVVAYFPVLAANRDSDALVYWSELTNRYFVILLVGGFCAGLLAGMKLVPPLAIVAGFSVAGVLFYLAWMKMLWHAFKATQPIARDFDSAFRYDH